MDLVTLNENQRLAVTSTASSILVVATPGSGKTRVLTERIKCLCANGTPPVQIVAITFTNMAAAEMRQRLPGLELSFIGTLHAFLLRLLQQHGALVGLLPAFSIVDEHQAEEILMEIAHQHRCKAPKAELRESIAAGPVSTLGEGTPGGRNLSPVELVNMDFYAQLQAGNMLTFDGVLHYGLRLLKRMEKQGVSLPYSHILVDEYQDSAPVDAEIYEALPIANKFMVGDPDQSVYGFRGGSPAAMLEMARHASECRKGAPLLILLQESYRCDQEIATAATRLIMMNKDRVGKAVMSQSGDAGRVEHRQFNNPAAELAAIATDLSRMSAPEQNQTAILLRSNALVSEYADYLTGMGIPVHRKNYHAEAADWPTCRVLLALLVNPDNDALAFRWLRLSVGANRASQVKLDCLERGDSINATYLNLPNFSDPRIETVRCEDNNRIALSYHHVSHRLNIHTELVPLVAKHGISEQSLDRIRRALALLPPGAGVAELLIALGTEDTTSEETGEGVMVCTLHAAKGREWNTVYMPAMEHGVLPITSKGTDLAEERRLAFVGMTRARHHLIMSWCACRKTTWERVPHACTPSQFLAECQSTLC